MVFTSPESFPLPELVQSVLEASLWEGGVKNASEGRRQRKGGGEVVMEYGRERMRWGY